MGKNYLPKVNKKPVVETWSWYNSIVKNQWSVYSTVNNRLNQSQRLTLVKWAKKSTKKKRGLLQPQAQLIFDLYSKPNGVRMGSGRGRPNGKFSWVRRGRSVLSYLDLKRVWAENICKFFKKSNLKLKLVQRRL